MSEPLFSRDQARAIEHRAKIADELAQPVYGAIPSLLARFSLIPASTPEPGASFYSRTNDHATVTITPGAVYDPQTRQAVQGTIPGGGLANLSFMWLVNEVRQNLTRQVDSPERVDLGSNLNEYLRLLGISKSGPRYRQAKEALRSVLGASIQLHKFSEETRDGMAGRTHLMARAHVSDSFELWESNGNELDGFRPHVIGSEALLRLASEPGASPGRFDLLAQLANSVLAQQALNWLSLRVWALNISNRQFDEFEWEDFYRNITHDYTRLDDFQRAWKRALARAVDHYPAVRDYLDLAARPSNPGTDARRRIVRLRRGAALLIPEREFKQLEL